MPQLIRFAVWNAVSVEKAIRDAQVSDQPILS
jgi:hypothetical protein